MLIYNNTLVEHYEQGNTSFYVKREDLACRKPGPPFAKIRGLLPHLRSLQQHGIQEVGYMDTAISMAGWGIAYLCQSLGMHAVIYYPKYKDGGRHNQDDYIPRWKYFGATVIPIEHPTKLQININVAKRMFLQEYSNGMWLENGLRLKETIQAVEEECVRTLQITKECIVQPNSIVCSVGSGVMLAGVIRGLLSTKADIQKVYGVLVNKYANTEKKLQDIHRYAEAYDDLITPIPFDLCLINAGLTYEEKIDMSIPFPCNPYYDAKAYKWMLDNIAYMPHPVLFWNIGG